jgi:small subunit ribosomal protein S13
MLDSYTPFRIRVQQIRGCNVVQLLSRRFGLGFSLSVLLCSFTGIHKNMKVWDLVDYQFYTRYTNFYVLKKLRSFFLTNKSLLDDSLKSQKGDFIKFLKDIKSLRGRNHRNYIPVRGQNNRTNARTRKKGKF